MNALSFFAYDPNDTDEDQLAKTTIFLLAGACTIAGVIWTVMYYRAFGWGLTSFLPSMFVFIVGGALLISHFTRNISYAIYSVIVCIIYVTSFVQWSIGGLFASGFVLAWAFCGPIGALIFFPFRKSVVWLLLYLANLLITMSFDDFFARNGQVVDEETQRLFFIMNLSFSSIVIFVFAGYFVSIASRERRRGDALLLNTLPREIVPVLKSGQNTIADYSETSSILFCDIVGSTPLFSDMEPEDVVNWLNEVFSMFDQLVEKYSVEKIRTIGDNYMVASGVPSPRVDHANALAALALDMLNGLKQLPEREGKRVNCRLGINSGPVVAGVIGKSKFQYDIWGDTVNVASRMESHGDAGKIHISASTYELIKDDFECEYRGATQIKGKDELETWYLVGPKNS